ncbi:MAG: class I SAM-dependent methyltransferase, partial [Flavobacteriaceae bacterium]|nr:class I SAM-dependent methyltransferase [Flavobacteriaceae bacterium]
MRVNFFFFLFFSSLTFAQYTSDDWNSRDKWMNIEALFEMANVTPGYAVADVGSHEGYLTMHLAKRVGAQGKVYAVDINDYRLEKLEKHAKKR